ncbi:MAG: HD domain-containing protein [Planctomycetota bacterium]|nr:HD domain-containing protein [Planctomycetota bacterium]
MTNALRDIPELAQLESGGELVRIPYQQDVPFPPRVRALVDTAEFQRLQHISQLGLVSKVYPGATHTRFEHALGVYHNALRYLWHLSRDATFCQLVDPHHAEVLICAALLHDLGHWPFCHPIEDMNLDGLPPHEEFASEFLSPQRELAQVLIERWKVTPDEVLDLLVPKTDAPQLHLLRSILSGPIDIDKLDYLGRDSLHAGVPYGNNFDKNRLIQSLIVNQTGDGLAIGYKGKTAAELMVFARYVMFSEVYWHHAVRSATSMFARAFYELHQQFNCRDFFQLTEADTIAALRTQAAGTSVEPLLAGIFGPRRMLYKRLAEYSSHDATELYHSLAQKPYRQLVDVSVRLAHAINGEWNTNIVPTDLIIDAPPQQKEVEIQIDIYYPKEGIYRSLYQASPVIAALASTQFDDSVKRVRIYAAPDAAKELRNRPGFAEKLTELIDSVV